MNLVFPRPGTYIIAVSGGVDSVALLHALHHQNSISRVAPWKLVVAHFDHGIRMDSISDCHFVQQLARQYGLPFVYDAVRLGPETSEATARTARYAFLQRVRQISRAESIITAHHQDDVLETAIFNMLRGTDRKGLTALTNRRLISRPLLNVPKRALLDYAHHHNLSWREDPTNSDTRYARNYIRHQLLTKFDASAHRQLLDFIRRQQRINDELDKLIASHLRTTEDSRILDRLWFITQPHAVCKELLASWLRPHTLVGFDRQSLERLTVGAKVARAGSRLAIKNNWFLEINKDNLALLRPER